MVLKNLLLLFIHLKIKRSTTRESLLTKNYNMREMVRSNASQIDGLRVQIDNHLTGHREILTGISALKSARWLPNTTVTVLIL